MFNSQCPYVVFKYILLFLWKTRKRRFHIVEDRIIREICPHHLGCRPDKFDYRVIGQPFFAVNKTRQPRTPKFLVQSVRIPCKVTGNNGNLAVAHPALDQPVNLRYRPGYFRVDIPVRVNSNIFLFLLISSPHRSENMASQKF